MKISSFPISEAPEGQRSRYSPEVVGVLRAASLSTDVTSKDLVSGGGAPDGGVSSD